LPLNRNIDMALLALSPGFNNTTTAIIYVDYPAAILGRLASRNIPLSHRYKGGKLRIVAIGPTFATLAAESFDRIRGRAIDSLGIMLRMLGGLQTIASLTANPSRRQALRDQAQWVAELADRIIESPHNRVWFENRLAHVRSIRQGAGLSRQGTKEYRLHWNGAALSFACHLTILRNIFSASPSRARRA
jgi:uncharacterized membrane protein